MEWLKDATNALEQEDSPFWIITGVFLLNSRFLFIRVYLDRPRLFQMIVSDEFLKQCDTEALLKFDGCFSIEFAR